MSNNICFYHKDCYDGIAAACAVKAKYSESECIAIAHNDLTIPDITDRDVIVVDFSFPLEMMREMIYKSRSFIVLDHHESFAPTAATLLAEQDRGDYGSKDVVICYDITRSGALIAWEFFHEGPVPELVDHINDRDLWRFDLPFTREIMAAVSIRPYEMSAWMKLLTSVRNPIALLIAEGTILIPKIHQDVDNVLRTTLRYVELDGEQVPLANCPYFLASDVLSKVCETAPYALSYFDTPTHRTFSIRSARTGPNVSVIAARHGGGGHYHASGFSVQRDHPFANM